MRLPQFVRDARSTLFERRALKRWRQLVQGRPGKPHGLPGELVVSLTSYPPRFPTLALTLACLCDQSVRADRIILWIAHNDIEKLPDEVRWNMRQAGVEICDCDELGPYKKLIPALEAAPDAFIATADDDLYYPRNWLESLVSGFDGRSIICRRANYAGSLTLARASEPRSDIIPSSGAGVLFPPHSLNPKVTDRVAFLSRYPTDDDRWYFEMAQRPIRKVNAPKNPIAWRGTQECSLWNTNRAELASA
ncbi:MAG TPA: hypothetical protein VFK15_07180 [Burkholderiales bacterium]|nr:hypothetical protein [Burkholderiales bacterium]